MSRPSLFASALDRRRWRAAHRGVRALTGCLLLATTVVAIAGCKGSGSSAPPTTLRLGFFVNVTHAAALVGLGEGTWARALEPVTIEPKPFNAGPEAMEALLAGALDACFVGPAPAINTYLRSHGEALVVVAGAAANGAGLVVRKAANITGPNDLHGKRIASPQLGNTQDVALRTYLGEVGLRTSERGGDVRVLPLANPDILTLMQRGELDAAWVPEPWLTRLVDEAGGKLLIDERERWPERRFPVTLLVVSRALVKSSPALVQKLVDAHVATLRWVGAHGAEARALTQAGLEHWAHKRLPPEQLESAWSRVELTWDPQTGALDKQLRDARALGFAPAAGSLDGFVDRHFLDNATAAH